MRKGYTYEAVRATFNSARKPNAGKPIKKALRIFKAPNTPDAFEVRPYSTNYAPIVTFSPSELTLGEVRYDSQTYERLKEVLPWPVLWSTDCPAFTLDTPFSRYFIVPGLMLQHDGLALQPELEYRSGEPARQVYSFLRRFRARLRKHIERNLGDPRRFTQAPTCSVCGTGGWLEDPEDVYRQVMQLHTCDRNAWRFATRDGAIDQNPNSYAQSYVMDELLKNGSAARMMNWWYHGYRKHAPALLKLHLERTQREPIAEAA